jgi:hypothetical protein
LLERKVRARDIKSQAGIRKSNVGLQRLFQSHLAELFIETMRPQDFIRWRDGCATLVAEGRYSPVTMNTDLSVLRVIMTSAKVELELPANPAEALAPFNTSQHPVYTFEEPNSLTVDELREFLRCTRESFPRHYAMTFLGFALGKRPSSTRPLRRRGATPDIHWYTGVLLFRRSNTHGQIVMEGVKTGGEERVQAPAELLTVLRWHVETQLRSPAQQASDLLFPALHGGFRTRNVLDKPFRTVAREMGLGKRITPRGMRRTFQDLCRAAEVGDLVTRSISGHATEAMQHHYSTVAPEEQRRGLSNVIQLMRPAHPTPHGSGEGPWMSGEDRKGGRCLYPYNYPHSFVFFEGEKRFELSTSTLARLTSPVSDRFGPIPIDKNTENPDPRRCRAFQAVPPEWCGKW